MKEKNKEIPVVESSLPCHSNVGKWEGGNLWEATQKSKIVMDDFRKHRSHATAQSSVGMTCILKPALTIVKASLLCHSYVACGRRESIEGGSRVTFRAKHDQIAYGVDDF